MKEMSDGCSDMANRTGSISNTEDHLPAVHINFATSTAKKCHPDSPKREALDNFPMNIHWLNVFYFLGIENAVKACQV
jgi:hypothetical protein